MPTPPVDPPILDPQVQLHLQVILQRAEKGDQTVLPDLRQILDANPQAWQRLGNLAQQAEDAWLKLIAGDNLVYRESLVRQLEKMRTELAGADLSNLERLLVDQVVIGWLQMQYADHQCAQGPEVAPAVHATYLKRQKAAQSRYLEAIRCLTAVQKLPAPGPAPEECLPISIAQPRPSRQGTGSEGQL